MRGYIYQRPKRRPGPPGRPTGTLLRSAGLDLRGDHRCGVGTELPKRGLRHLIARICSGEVDRLVLAHKDRLLRFGADLVFSLCEHFAAEVVIIKASKEANLEEDLAQDAIEIVTVFSARLYGSCRHKNRKLMEELRAIAAEVGS